LVARSFDELLADAVALTSDDHELASRVGTLRALASMDPESGLMKVRKLLEYVIHDLYGRRFREPPGTRPLENLLQRMAKEGGLPRKLGVHANLIRELGNLGVHSFGETTTPADVEGAVAFLVPILAWYREEIGPPTPRGEDPSPSQPAVPEIGAPDRSSRGRRRAIASLLGLAALAVGASVAWLRFGAPEAPMNRGGLEPTRGIEPQAESGRVGSPRILVLAVGISDYRDPRFRLNVAHKDAQAIADAFRKQEGTRFGSVLASVLTDRAATGDAILKGLRALQASAGADDLAVVALSGHGTIDDRGDYHFLPSDFQAGQDLSASALSWDDFRRRLGRMPCPVWLVLDTCHGSRVNRELLRGLAPFELERSTDRAFRHPEGSDRGLVITAASMAGQDVAENKAWGHGALTLALLEGLQGQRIIENGRAIPMPHQLGRDGQIDLEGLTFFASRRVAELTKGAQSVVTTVSPGLDPSRIRLGVVRDGSGFDEDAEPPRPARPPNFDPLRVAAEGFADQIASILKSRCEPSIAIGAVLDDGSAPATSGVAWKRALADAFDGLDVAVRKDAPLNVESEISLPPPDGERFSARIRVSVVEAKGGTLFTGSRKIEAVPDPGDEKGEAASALAPRSPPIVPEFGDGVGSIASLFAVTASLPADKDRSVRNQMLAGARQSPEVSVTGGGRLGVARQPLRARCPGGRTASRADDRRRARVRGDRPRRDLRHHSDQPLGSRLGGDFERRRPERLRLQREAVFSLHPPEARAARGPRLASDRLGERRVRGDRVCEERGSPQAGSRDRPDGDDHGHLLRSLGARRASSCG
jgi:hypothetical protein